MIRKAILLACLAVGLSASAVNAQQGSFYCGTDAMNEKIRQMYPEAVAANEAQMVAYMESQLQQMNVSKYAKVTGGTGFNMDTVYHIPIVFHVIHDYGTENVADTVIYRVVRQMTEFYMKRNGDTADVIAPYKGFIPNTRTRYIGKANIQFHLAARDPLGRPTNGITRRRNYITNEANGDKSKFDGWAPDSYLNIWISKSFANGVVGGVLAYAYAPPTAAVIPDRDGVIAATWQPLDYDHTLSHEVGHSLNLAHTWGNTNDPGVGCGDDGVEDTPPTIGHQNPGCVPAALYDMSCSYFGNNALGKQTLDTTHTTVADSVNNIGVTFNTATTVTVNSVSIYPAASIGKPFKILLKQNNTSLDSTIGTVSVTSGAAQLVTLNYNVPAGNNYSIVFAQNPNSRRDSVFTTINPTSGGAISITNAVSANGRYNYFYDWKVSYGYFRNHDSATTILLYDTTGKFTKLTPSGTLTNGTFFVDYPDTVNSQNVMDYTSCAKMFTNGQAVRMRQALTNPVAYRSSLITKNNLVNTGVANSAGVIVSHPDVPPVAEYSINAIQQSSSDRRSADKVYGCQGSTFSFTNRSWGDTITSSSLQWIMSNNAANFNLTSTGTTTGYFRDAGWATVALRASTNGGVDTDSRQAVYIADSNNRINASGYYQEFDPAGADIARYPIFNYYNNPYKWQVMTGTGYTDNFSMSYRAYDERTNPTSIAQIINSPIGDYDDFFTPPFDLSAWANSQYCNMNFMYSCASRTNVSANILDALEIYGSADCGTTWSLIKTMTKSELNNMGYVAESFTPANEYQWAKASFEIPLALRNRKTLFRFRYVPNGNKSTANFLGTGNNFYLDRLHFGNNPTGVDEVQLGARGMALVPNPTSGAASVVVKNATQGKIQVTVTDLTGKLVYKTEQSASGATTAIEIPAANISVKGVYMVQVTSGSNRQTEKLVVY